MHIIRRLDITGVRNLEPVSLRDLAQINLLYGENGAGKTSVLEAIHLLSSARSFRSHKLDPLINTRAQSCIAFAEINVPSVGFQPVGVERFKASSEPGVLKVAGEVVRSVSVLADNLPLQVISADTFKLLEGAPTIRRQFLDWGVFHVEHNFYQAWKSARKCLKHRNSLLRHDRIDRAQLAVWTAEFSRLGEQIDSYRQQYIRQLAPVFERVLGQLIELEGLGLSYFRGWDKEHGLAEVLESQLERDLAQRFTHAGPHRADLRLRYQGANAADILSRGQQKLVVCALRVAQGYLLSEIMGRPCVFLVDDLPAELDAPHRKALCQLLEALGCQVFVTCVDRQALTGCWSNDAAIKTFHVEQGKITAVYS